MYNEQSFLFIKYGGSYRMRSMSSTGDSGNSRRSLSSVLVEVVETHDPKDGTVYVRYDRKSGAKIIPNPQNDSIE